MPPMAFEALVRIARPRRHFRGPVAGWPDAATYGSGSSAVAESTIASVPDPGADAIIATPAVTTRATLATLWALRQCPPDGGAYRVVDFGGGGAPQYYLVRALMPASVSLDWVVVELPEVVSVARAVAEVRYVTDTEQVDGPVDVVISDSCLQYLADPIATLGRLVALRPSAIVLNRLPLTPSGNGYVLLQTLKRGGSVVEFPMHVLAQEQFENSVAELGLQIDARWIGGDGYRIRHGVRAVDVHGLLLRCTSNLREAEGG